MKPTVLIVEDEPDVLDLVRYNLNRAGFDVLTAASGDEGLRITFEQRPDVLVLDLMLPGLDGHEVCRQLKEHEETRDIPILMLTAKAGTKDRVQGLELGAEDYVPKPFSPRELVLRVQALHRRACHRRRSEHVSSDIFDLDKGNFELRIEGRKIDLTTTEFKLFSLLLEKRGRVLSRETLLVDVWGYQSFIDTRTVDTHMRRLREKLGEYAGWIETIRGEGYRFITTPAEELTVS